MKRFYMHALGCQTNIYDSLQVSRDLTQIGWNNVNSPEEADVFILLTCAVDEVSEKLACNILKQVKDRLRHDVKVIYAGCMVKQTQLVSHYKDLERLNKILPSHLTISARDIHKTKDIISQCFPATVYKPNERGGFTDIGLYAGVPITKGCNNYCTYCIIPYRRGPHVSRPMQDILDDVKRLADAGVKVITLLGQNILQYEGNLFNLIDKVHNIDDIKRIYFSSFHPKNMNKQQMAIFDRPKVCAYLRIPVQAGHNDVLARMNRGYTIEHFTELIETMRTRRLGIAITTDFIVGFPGETREHFEGSIELAKKMKFDGARVAIYSERKGTRASKDYTDNITTEEKVRRRVVLNEVIHETVLANNRELIGGVLEVLIDSQEGQISIGRTVHAKKVLVTDRKVESGQLIPVRIENAETWTLFGKAEV